MTRIGTAVPETNRPMSGQGARSKSGMALA